MALGASAAAMPWLLLDLASAVGGLADLLAYLLSFNFTWLWLLLPCATLLHVSMGASMREPYTQNAGSCSQIAISNLVSFVCFFWWVFFYKNE